MKLRDYQETNALKGVEVLRKLMIVYYTMMVRTGKTLTALETAKLFGAKNVLFLTKKKAIDEILNDYKAMNYQFSIIVINNESVHTISPRGFDLIISDEHYRNAAFPKPNKVTKYIKQHFGHLPMIFLSGTPNPESYSQIYHQFWVSNYSPFKEENFYRWANNYVNKGVKYTSYGQAIDYSNAKQELIKPIVEKYMITFTQKEAGFVSQINENILEVEMLPQTYKLVEMIKKDRVIKGKTGEVILADTGVKLQSKVHQLFSGTCKFESGISLTLDPSKAYFIKRTFEGKKIAIFYKFKQEYETILKVFGDSVTDNLEVFNSTDKNIALQIVSGREGISLKNAECLVYYNIDFSALSYWQSRDRLTTMERTENDIYWIFARGGIELNIYMAVMNKKDYTLSTFRKDYEIKNINRDVRIEDTK
jgi:hypothetical protein